MVLYYRDILNLKPKERKEKLYKFCEDSIPDFNKALYYKTINRALNKGSDRKQKLVTIEKVDVYKDEVDYINSLDIEYDYKKLLFAFLIQMRLNKLMYEERNHKRYTTIYFKGGKQKYQNIKSMANVSNKIDINEDFISDLSQGNNPLIQTLHTGLIRLDFINNCEQTGGIVIEAKDYDNVGWYLDYYNHIDKVILCGYCGQPFKQNKKNEVYCKKHKEYQPVVTKIIYCVDCGRPVEIDSKDNQTVRCAECQHKHWNEYNAMKQREYYKKKKSV